MTNKNSLPPRPRLDWQSFEELFKTLRLAESSGELMETVSSFAEKELQEKLAEALKEFQALYPRLMGEEGLAKDCGSLAAELDQLLNLVAGQLSQALELEKAPPQQRAAEISRLMGAPDGAGAVLNKLERDITNLETNAAALGKEMEAAANHFRQLDAVNQANRALGSWGVEMRKTDEALAQTAKALGRALLPSKKENLRQEIKALETQKDILIDKIGKARGFTAFYERFMKFLWINGPIFIELEKILVQLVQGFHAPRLAIESLLAGDTVAFPAASIANGLAALKQTHLLALDYFRP